MNFKEYIKEAKSRGYVALNVTPESKDKIYNVLEKYIDTKTLISALHMTLMYDESSPNINIKPSDSVYDAKVTDITTLGESDSEWHSVVLKLKSDDINSRFKELTDAGFKHSYDEFVQHVSLIYGPTETDTNKLLNNKNKIIKDINTIKLNNETFEAINKPDPDKA